jgi:hypothetical protein
MEKILSWDAVLLQADNNTTAMTTKAVFIVELLDSIERHLLQKRSYTTLERLAGARQYDGRNQGVAVLPRRQA